MDEQQKPKLIDLQIIPEIADTYANITEEHILRLGGRLPPALPNDKNLGTVHNEAARRMWTVADYYDRLSCQWSLKAKFDGTSPEESAEFVRQSSRFAGFEHVARQLFWLSVKDDIGGRAWTSNEIGVRAGWMIVASTGAKQALTGLLGNLGGSLGLPPGFTPPSDDDES